jgi:selenocysteine-specific elongation factor
MTLAPPETFRVTDRIDTRLSLLRGAKPLKDRARVHVHVYTTETVAEVRPLDSKELRAGDEQWVRLRLDNPTLALPDDRFIVRQFSPLVTVGGGIVLDATPLRRKLAQADVARFLSIMTTGTLEERLAARVERHGTLGFAIRDIPTELNIRREAAVRLATQSRDSSQNSQVLVQCDQVLVTARQLSYATHMVRNAVEQFQLANPLVPGISREELRARAKVGHEIFARIMLEMAEKKTIELAGDLVRLPGRGVVMKDEEAESKKVIEQAFASAGLQVPALQQVLAGLKLDKARAQKIVTLLLRDKVLVKISEDLVFHQSALANLRRQMAALKSRSAPGAAKVDVGKFKEMTGVSRKYAIPLLEYLDREHVTKRVGDERVIL